MREKLYAILEPRNQTTRLGHIYDWVMIVLITISLIPLMFKEANAFLLTIEVVTLVVFILDYLCRWWTADLKLGYGMLSFFLYPFTPMAIVDLLSIIPGLGLINPSYKLLRTLRLVRVTGVFKLLRYSKSAYIISRVFHRQRNVMMSICLLTVSYILISALVIFNVEPDTFADFFEAVYWATMSLTTVGYGDICPTSAVGRAVAMLSSVLGIAVVALPAGVITAGYMDELHDFDPAKFARLRDRDTYDWFVDPEEDAADSVTAGEEDAGGAADGDDGAGGDATCDGLGGDATCDGAGSGGLGSGGAMGSSATDGAVGELTTIDEALRDARGPLPPE